MVPTDEKKFFVLTESNLLIFNFMICDFYIKNILPNFKVI